MNEAIGKIRAALKGHDLLGAEAVELKPGAVVLVVLRYAAKISPAEAEMVGRAWSTMADMLQAEGVRAVACCVPHGFALDVIEVAGEAPSDDRSVLGADGREIARLRSAPSPSPAEVEAVTRRADAAAQAFVAHVFTGPKSTEGMSAEEVEAAKARELEAFPLVTLTTPDTLAPEVRADLAAYFARPIPARWLPAAPPPPDEPFPWDAPAEGFGVATGGPDRECVVCGKVSPRMACSEEHWQAFKATPAGALWFAALEAPVKP